MSVATDLPKSKRGAKTLTDADHVLFHGISSIEMARVTGRFDVETGGGVHQCYFHRGAGHRLFAMFNGRVDRSKVAPPVFNRWSWAPHFPGSVLYINDPMLLRHGTLRLGWYAGTTDCDVMADVAALVRRVAAQLGIRDSGIVGYGSSGGGFAALALASRIPGATAVAINAQTSICAYFAGAVREYTGLCYPGLTPEEAEQRYPERFSMPHAFAAVRGRSKAFFVQNIRDEHHYSRHFLPFARRFGMPPETGIDRKKGLGAILYSDPRGHIPETPEMLPEILGQVSALAEGGGIAGIVCGMPKALTRMARRFRVSIADAFAGTQVQNGRDSL